ncbi:MAG: tyrosine-type recombinase/integrase [Bryobacteraceae bacterium]|jgi:integrase
MAVFKRGKVWWYEFIFAGRRVRESVKTHSKTVAKLAEQKRRRELEEGFNGLEDTRDERIKSMKELAAAYLAEYKLRHRSVTFAEYAVGNVTRHLGELMAVDVTDKTVKTYQTARLKEKAAPKTINEEVGFLLRLLGEAGEPIRARLRRQKSLKLAIREQVGKAYTPEEKAALLAAARAARSPSIYPALMLALNAGMRDAEIRGLQWGRMDLFKAYLTVGDSKTEAGEGRTIPLNSDLLEAMVEYSKWYTKRFHTIKPEWFVFPARIGTPATGKKRPLDPTKPMVTLKTSWNNVKAKAKVTGRWHDNRHTLITDLAESGAGDETIRDIAGHVSKQMLKHYSHIRMEAKRTALESIVVKKADPKPAEEKAAVPTEVPTIEAVVVGNSNGVPTKVPTVDRAN